MSITQDIQSLEPGGIVTLYELDAEVIGAAKYYFHSHMTEGVITWQGIEYHPWNIEADGFEKSGGASPTPRLRVANIGGMITALCLNFDDLAGAVLYRRQTLVKYLDGQPEADPDEHFPDEIWYIEQKMGETRDAVDFELSSALDFNGEQLPARPIISMCWWQYRDANCTYAGPPVADEYDIITTDAEQDKCGYRLQSCKLRFGENAELPFGGFPAASLI